ncbi:hypothetical protein GGP89_002421 [Salinibacter ruber]|uniref:Uncharacterized protein n=1 Tax=Salinibacter ruber TaxID=146919 RepID=A0A9X2R9E6_9BACT|nr:hypothetical protein [Salinibacter ruber]MCS3859029.1 hypothetical protein [Salinibacter ruber]MCS3865894.1 hypothetical protein [Salinibacter ruber]
MDDKGFRVQWTADHIQTGYETAYAVGEDRMEDHKEHIREMYDGAAILNVEEIPAERAMRITRRRGSGA